MKHLIFIHTLITKVYNKEGRRSIDMSVTVNMKMFICRLLYSIFVKNSFDMLSNLLIFSMFHFLTRTLSNTEKSIA